MPGKMTPWKVYQIFLWVMALIAIYGLLVMAQLATAERTVLLKAGEITQNGTLLIPSFTTIKWCEPIQPQEVNFSTFIYAANPYNWGTTLQNKLHAEYCNKPYSFPLPNYGENASYNISAYIPKRGG